MIYSLDKLFTDCPLIHIDMNEVSIDNNNNSGNSNE